MSQSGLSLRSEHSGSASVIHVVGELDLSTVDALETALGQQHGNEPVVVVLAECTFIDSSALRSLILAQRSLREQGTDLVLVAPSQPARRVLEVAALDRIIPVHETVDSAVLSLT